MTRPGFEDYDGYDWAMHYFLRIAAITAGTFSVAWTAWLLFSGT